MRAKAIIISSLACSFAYLVVYLHGLRGYEWNEQVKFFALRSVSRHLKPSLGPQQPTIPRKMWFTYRHNLLETNTPTNLYENVLHTIRRYREFWSVADAPVHFLDDAACREMIMLAEPKLVPHFNGEENGAYKADICRVCALYLHGGYYFDVDMLVVEPYRVGVGVAGAGAGAGAGASHHDDQAPLTPTSTSFVSVLSCGGTCFFNSFLASAPGHPILERAMKEMLDVYENGQSSVMIGPITLFKAYSSLVRLQAQDGVTQQINLSEVHLLREMELGAKDYPDLERLESRAGGTGRCSFVVDDPAAATVYFFSRIPGAGGCLSYQDRMDTTPIPPLIPRRIWFNYKHNMMEADGATGTSYYGNVRNTVKAHRDAWKNKYASVDFFDEDTCNDAIANAEPSLLPHFRQETSSASKSALCKFAVLHQHGGYFVDIDLRVLEAYQPPETTAFAAATRCGDTDTDTCLTTSFLASRPGHPILARALKKMLYFYESQAEDLLDGDAILTNSYFHAQWEEAAPTVSLLQEVELDESVPPASAGSNAGYGNCNHGFRDPISGKLHFSLTAGTSTC